MTVPGALSAIEAVAATAGADGIVGVGSVTDAQEALRAVEAGAEFVVSPVFKREVVDADWDGTVLPTFRPDALFDITAADWPDRLDALRERCGMTIDDYGGFIDALEDRRAFFKEMGAVATDHAVLHPYTERLSEAKADAIFRRGPPRRGRRGG